VTGLRNYRTFTDPLAEQAENFPSKTAFIYLADGDEKERSLSFRELHERALGLAHQLGSSHRCGDRVLLLLPPGLDYVITLYGCFYAGVVAVSAPPPNPRRLQRTLSRLLAIAADAGVAAVVTTADLLNIAQAAVPDEHPLLAAEWMAVDEIPGTTDTSAIAPPGPSDVAVLQYTSGSTADPRGVELTHSNLLDNSRFIAEAFEHRFSDVGFNWIPPFHDMGLIGAILQPTYCGGLSVLASPMAIVKRPLLWLKGIHRYRARTSGGPDFFYDICAERVHPEDCEGLDLSCWQVAFNGAEPVRAKTLEAFTRKFEAFGFRPEAFLPCYGLAEATLMVTAPPRDELPTVRQFDSDSLESGQAVPSERIDSSRLVGCGSANERHRLRIVEPETRIPLKIGEIGEIWIGGPSVAKGYRGASEEGGRIFGATLLEEADDRRYLRTGDLGFLDGEELFVVGRISDLIVIRGRNYHPHDIEDLAESTTPLLVRHASAAFELDDGHGPGIALVAEVEDVKPSAGRTVIASIRNRVAEDLELPLVRTVLCRRGTVPKTTSGKVQRRLCRSLLLAGELETVTEWRASA
jgi:acyl-CoA synthetase (AMP-forming)/AMP-acid ligase II